MALCIENKIAIKDPKTRAHQCQDCLKCAAGEGLSVQCGDVIGPNTPIVCEPCVLGKTYSPGYEAGACKASRDCSFESRETKKACTLTSNAVCGKCKSGFYPDGLLGLCQPCSYCCNDGSDISPPECAVAGVPENKRCSVHRSEKCSKLASSSTISTKQTSPTLASSTPRKTPTVIQQNPPTPSVRITATTAVNTTQLVQQQALTQSPASSLNLLAVFLPVSLLILILVAVVWAWKKKRNTKFAKVPGCDDAEQRGSEASQENEDEADPAADGVKEREEENSPLPTGVEETESPLPTGVMESQPPGSYSQDEKFPVDGRLFSPSAQSDDHSHPNAASSVQATVELSATISINGNGEKDNGVFVSAVLTLSLP